MKKELISYLIFGVLTTVVNIVVYYVFNTWLQVNYLVSNAIAWIASVLFAYITNRKYVFESENTSMFNELVKFIGARLSTGIMDMIFMWLLVDVLSMNSMISKIVVNVLVIVLNYVLSKVFVFKKEEV
jgi:putative flippase GtrA